MQSRKAAIGSAAILDLLTFHAGYFRPFFVSDPDADAALIHATGLGLDQLGLVGDARRLGPK